MEIANQYKKKDEQLFAEVQKLKDGDFSNSNAVYELSEKYIYKIINDIVKNHHTTEDLMQEAYIQIYNKIGTLQEVKAFYVWAGRIATNLTLRYIQKNSKEVLATADEEGDTDFIFDTASEDNEKFIPESVLVDREKQRLIAEIIDKLSTEQKICIQYFYYEEMSVNQIAEAMGCSTGTIKSRLNYARKAIKEAVVELDEKHGTRLYSLASAPLFLIIFRAAVEGLLPAAAAGAASAAAVGGASSVGNAASVGGASVAGSTGSASTAGSAANAGASAKALNTASIAEKSVLATEKGPSASRIEEVKNLVLKKLKKMGGDIKADTKKASEAAKETVKEHGSIIKDAFQNGKKEGAKQIVESAGKCTVNALKGIGACTVTTKFVIAAIVVILVIPKNAGHPPVPMEAPISLTENPVAVEETFGHGEETVEGTMREEASNEDVKVKEAKAESFPVGIIYQEYRFDDGRIYYNTPDLDEYYTITEAPNVFFQCEEEGCSSLQFPYLEISSWPTDMGNEFLNYVETFYKKGEIKTENGPYKGCYELYANDENEEFSIIVNGNEYICKVDHVLARTWLIEEERHKELNGEYIDLAGSYYFYVGISADATPVNSGNGEVSATADSTSTGTEYATTHPSAAGIADPSETANITMPDIEFNLPTVEEVSNMEAFQAVLYEKYALFDNVTDEMVYERMGVVPCTVYLEDGSVYSITLAEFMYKDWSGYADLDKIDYDENLAQEIVSGYVTTDSLID